MTPEPDSADGVVDEPAHEDPVGVESVEMYETDDGIVFYDAMNPLAWVHAPRSVPLPDCV